MSMRTEPQPEAVLLRNIQLVNECFLSLIQMLCVQTQKSWRQYYLFRRVRGKRNREESKKKEKKGNGLEEEDEAQVITMQVLINYSVSDKADSSTEPK